MRISERFEQRVMGILGELMTEAELSEVDHEITGVIYPQQGEPGMPPHPALGFNIALSRHTMAVGEHLLIMDTCFDPYKNDAELKLQVTKIVEAMREHMVRVNARGNGHSEKPPSRLIIPGRG